MIRNPLSGDMVPKLKEGFSMKDRYDPARICIYTIMLTSTKELRFLRLP